MVSDQLLGWQQIWVPCLARTRLSLRTENIDLEQPSIAGSYPNSSKLRVASESAQKTLKSSLGSALALFESSPLFKPLQFP
ncbi:hypothetical protein MUK42_35225 [Musa troglodytarum]|uniref:Uncharacterized protein n=1 Tax=Musa troglodytarum TaxID=320322 RepID=A0A9E7KD65_9LILI|nr:hypothetical protein MUK42_35225 [Musa troglodytarum]